MTIRPSLTTFFISVLICLSGLSSYAQQVTLLPADSSKVQNTSFEKKQHSPKKAALLSVALPGLGQAYNRKFWKIPIVYAGFAGLSYVLYRNVDRHRCYKDAYRLQVDGDVTTIGNCRGVTNSTNLKALRDLYRRNIDLTVAGMAVWYLLNVVDATVDAHLFEFDVSDDLSLRVEPKLNFYQSFEDYSTFAGVSMKLKL